MPGSRTNVNVSLNIDLGFPVLFSSQHFGLTKVDAVVERNHMSKLNACQSPEAPHFEVSMQRTDTIVEVGGIRGTPNADGGLHELRTLYTLQDEKQASRLAEILNAYRQMQKFIAHLILNPKALSITEMYECQGLLQQSPQI